MKRNVGGVDRMGRIALGVIVTSLAFVGPQSPWAYIGLVPLITGLVGFCPLYPILGFSTCNECKK